LRLDTHYPCLAMPGLEPRAAWRLIESGRRCPACPLRRTWGRGWRATRERVFARYGRACWHRGAPAAMSTTWSRSTPVATTRSRNLRPSCARCNRGRR
jgi:hypothetical protein